MTVLLLYDIADDRRRTKAASVCLDFGLQRIQYSAFQGSLTAARRDELLAKLRRVLKDCDARLYLAPLCEKDARIARFITLGEMPPTPIPGKR